MNLRILFISLIFAFCSIGVSAQDSQALIQKASAAYQKGDFRAAADLYTDVLQKDGASAPLLFDIANSYSQLGDYGQAMLYYAKARRLNPSDTRIDNNMRFVASKVEDANRAELKGKKVSVTADPETFFDSLHRIVAKDHLSDTWAVWSVVSFILMLGCIAVYLFCVNVTLRKAGFFGAFSLLMLCVVLVVCAFSAAKYQSSDDEAVLTAYKTELRLEPSSDSKPASSQICQGSILKVIAEETDIKGDVTWCKVRLNSNFEGWLPASEISII